MGYACLQLNMKAVRDDVIHYAISHSPGAKHEFHISIKALKQGTFPELSVAQIYTACEFTLAE